MARNNRHNVAFVVGSVLGAVAGAAAALWKTPYSGEEVRAKLGLGGEHGDATTARVSVADGGDRSLKDKVLSGVEKTLAPIVGVELGKTANGSGTVGSDIKVNQAVAGTGGATTGEGVSTSHAADGSETLGLSQDRVDAEKWAAAYKGVDLDSDTGTTAAAQPSTQAPAPSAPTAGAASEQGALLRHPHSWKGDTTNQPSSGTASVTHAADGSEMIGLSRDKVDAEKWAAAYSGEGFGTKKTTTSSTDTGAATTFGNAHGYGSKAEESAAQTGQGAKPAYPGNDQSGRAPVNNQAPEDSVGDVSRGADVHTGRTADTAPVRPDQEAATIDQLTSPQVHRVPDSLRQPTEHGMHPFPKLGGKED